MIANANGGSGSSSSSSHDSSGSSAVGVLGVGVGRGAAAVGGDRAQGRQRSEETSLLRYVPLLEDGVFVTVIRVLVIAIFILLIRKLFSIGGA
jgi:hypothetical protein